MTSEETIINNALSGNQEAFRSIVDNYKRYVFAIIFNITKNTEEAENVAQETFLQVYRSLSTYNTGSFKSWIGKIATNKAIDWRRKHSREVVNNKVVYLEDVKECIASEEDRIEDKMIKDEEIQRLKAICSELPPIYGDVIEKYFIRSMNYQEIADEEGVSVRTIETRLYRAKKLLRENWREG